MNDARWPGMLVQSIPSLTQVLLVDDDADCIAELAEMMTSLGYGCTTATDVPNALRLLAELPEIGIVVTDLNMPMMDGLTFLDELSSRFLSVRPLVVLVITGHGTLDVAVQAMHLNASDFLAKPITRVDLSSAMRRASQRLAQLQGQFRLLGLLGKDAAGAPEADPAATPAPGEENLLGLVRAIVRQRERRLDFLDPEMFSDPVWDILLDLTSARLESQVVTVTSACAAARVPLTTGLRYIKVLVDNGLVRRWKDPTDQRRNLLELEDAGMDAMVAYLTEIGSRAIPV